MEKVLLYDEYRLIERNEAEVNSAWKGAHLLLFFLSFIFGSFCTFCFHILMYLFDEKCVLFPKLLSLSETRHSIIYEFIPDKSAVDKMPVDFVSTKWMDKSACYLPTYLPLLSGICGLIWVAMLLMSSSGYQTLTGSQRSWRIIPPIFVFSLMMGGLCIYSSAVTHSGLLELCQKLGEITGGSASCSYAINVATLAYSRRIRGVYQAVRLTILCAWLHTLCWLASAVLALVRVLLVVDFSLVRVRAELQGNVDKILEHQEKHIRTVSPDVWIKDHATNTTASRSTSSILIHFRNETFDAEILKQQDSTQITESDNLLQCAADKSSMSLVPEEQYKLERISAYEKVADDWKFILKMLHDILDSMEFSEEGSEHSINISSLSDLSFEESDSSHLFRQPGQQMLGLGTKGTEQRLDDKTAENLATELRHELVKRLKNQLSVTSLSAFNTETSPPTSTRTVRTVHTSMENTVKDSSQSHSVPASAAPSKSNSPTPSTLTPSLSAPVTPLEYESVINITQEMLQTLKRKRMKSKRNAQLKSSMKSTGVQTDVVRKKSGAHKVQIKSTTTLRPREVSEETLKPVSDEEQPLSDEDTKEVEKPKKEKQD